MLSERGDLPPTLDDPPESESSANLRGIHDRVLARLGGSWDHPPLVAAEWERDSELHDLRNEAKEIVEAAGVDADLVVLADPRTSLLLQFWQSVTPISGTVLVTRDPGEVAASAAVLSQIAPEHSADIWLRYVVSAWLGSETRLVIDHRDLIDDLPAVVARVAQFLGTAPPRDAEFEGITSSIEPPLPEGKQSSPAGPSLVLASTVHDLLATDGNRDLTPLFRALQESWRTSPRAEIPGEQAELMDDEAAALRGELYIAREQAREVERRYQALRKSRSVRTARWGAEQVKRVRRIARRAQSSARMARHRATSGTSGSEIRPELPPPAKPELDAGAQLSRLERLATRPHLTVIVPIFNAYEELSWCLASVERNSTVRDCDILLIDDASTDGRIAGLLEEWEQRECVRVLRNEENLGFTRTVNRGFAETTGDVVLLNSDCEVTPRWLQNLVDCAARHEWAATVTPLSDNAGAFSVPEIGVANDRPRHITRDEVGRLVSRTSERLYPTGPTGNGFCMYIKRRALDEVGFFDAESFPRGYGEEGDFCMRARAAGWTNVVDDATIVFHHRSASFGGEKDELMRAGRAKLDERHPDYTSAVRAFVRSRELEKVQRIVRAAYDESSALPRRIRPRILYVHHRGTGGTPETNADLMGALLEDYEPYLLTSDTKALELSRYENGGTELLERWVLPDRLRADEFTNPRYRATVADILTRYDIDLVHIRLLLAHSFDLPTVAHALDIPVILSFHDFFLVCPTVHLLDEADRFCAGVCTPGDGDCRIPSDWVRGVVPHLKHSWVKVWQGGVSHMIGCVDAFVTTSPAARAIYMRTYPELSGATFHLIEHGRDLPFEPVDDGPDLPRTGANRDTRRARRTQGCDVHPATRRSRRRATPRVPLPRKGAGRVPAPRRHAWHIRAGPVRREDARDPAGLCRNPLDLGRDVLAHAQRGVGGRPSRPGHRTRSAEGASRAARWRLDPRSPRPKAGV